MPSVVATALVSLGASATVATIASQLLVGVALTAITAAQAGGGPQAERYGLATQFAGQGDVTPQSIILGRTATAGMKMAPYYCYEFADPNPGPGRPVAEYFEDVGEGRLMTMVRSLSDVPVSGLVGLYVDGVYFDYEKNFVPDDSYWKITLDEDTLNDEQKPYKNRLWVNFYDGTQTEASPVLMGVAGSHPTRPWKETSVHKGGAYVAVTVRRDVDLYRNEPDLMFVVDGMKLLDPRDGVVKFTENPAIHLWHLYQSITFGVKNKYGLNYPRSALPDYEWFVAMNECDLLVPTGKEDGSVEPQFRTGYEIKVSQPDGGGQEPFDAIDAIRRSAAIQVTDTGGDVLIRTGAPTNPVAVITDDDILWSEAESLTPVRSVSDITNSIVATFPDSENKYATMQADTVVDLEAEVRDGGEFQTPLNARACPYRSQVSRLAEAFLKDAQRRRVHAIVLEARHLEKLKVYKTLMWASELHQYDNKVFEIQQRVIDPVSGQVGLLIREVEPSDWDSGDFVLADAPKNKRGKKYPDPRKLFNIDAVGVLSYNKNGTPKACGGLISWDPRGDRYKGVGVIVEIYRQGEETPFWTQGTPDGSVGSITVYEGHAANSNYMARARVAVPGRWEWTPFANYSTGAIALDESDFSKALQDRLTAAAKFAELQRTLALKAFVDADEAQERAKAVAVEANAAIEDARKEAEEARDIIRSEFEELDTIVTISIGTLDARVTQEIGVLQQENLSIAGRIDTVQAGVDEAKASIVQEALARATSDDAIALAAQTLTTRVAQAEASVTTEQLARSTADTALASQINTLTARVGDVEAVYESDQIVSASEFEALVSNVTSLSARIGTNESSIVSMQQVRTTGGTAFANLMTTLGVRANGTSAKVEQFNQTTVDQQGFATAFAGVTVTTQNGGVAGFKAVSFSNPDGTGGAVLDLLGSVVRAGTILSDRLIVGQGRNVLHDTDFMEGARFWEMTGNGNVHNQSQIEWRRPGDGGAGSSFSTMRLYQNGSLVAGIGQASALSPDPGHINKRLSRRVMPVRGGEYIMASARVRTVRCDGFLVIEWFDASGNFIGDASTPFPANNGSKDFNDPLDWVRAQFLRQVPSNARFAGFAIRSQGTTSGSDSAIYWWEPQLEASHGAASEPTPYSPRGTTLIGPNSIFVEKLSALTADMGTIQVLEANLGTANIIGTINLKDGAITAGSEFYNEAGVEITGDTWTTVATASLQTTGAPLEIFGGFEYYNENAIIYLRVTIDGTPTEKLNANGTSAAPFGPNYRSYGTVPEQVGAGNHTVRVQARFLDPNGSGFVRKRALTLKTNKK